MINNVSPLMLKTTAEVREIMETLRGSDKKGLFYAFATLAEQELLIRHFEHPSTGATFIKYGAVYW